jgi:hypothetical protein
MTIRTERVEPIKPKDIIDNLDDIIHPAVIKAVNTLLKEQYRGGTTRITLKEISKKAKEICPELTTKEMEDKKHLDFEPVFRKAGWKVTYDQPGWDESYDSFFEFSAK